MPVVLEVQLHVVQTNHSASGEADDFKKLKYDEQVPLRT